MDLERAIKTTEVRARRYGKSLRELSEGTIPEVSTDASKQHGEIDFPCPSCGETENFWSQHHPARGWYVMCDECDWRGPERDSEAEAVSVAGKVDVA